jgi:PAS domain-containing protein
MSTGAYQRERAIRAAAVTHPMHELTAKLQAAWPERKVWRTGPPYVYRLRHDSLGYATAAYCSAYWRLHRREIETFDAGWLSARLATATDPWDTLVPYFAAEGVPFLEPDDEGAERRLIPSDLYLTSRLEEIAAAVSHLGPVLAFLPWPGWWDSTSVAWGQRWVGPAGSNTPRLTATMRRHEFRGIVIKGISYRYHAVRIRDGFDNRPDLWLSLRALQDAMNYGGRALTIAA